MYDIVTFLMFEGTAEAAVDFYLSVFDDSELVDLHRYGPNEVGPEGTVEHATFRLNGQEFMAIDSNVKHAYTITPSISLFVGCETAQEVDSLYEKLSPGGEVMIALDSYPFSDRFCSISDRFGISWQLSLSPSAS